MSYYQEGSFSLCDCKTSRRFVSSSNKDNDGEKNDSDNCPLVANSDQLDSNNNGVGDACEDDCDGDTIPDSVDVCPCNNYISATDFRGFDAIDMGENSFRQGPPVWEFRDEGREIIQTYKSWKGWGNSPGIAIGLDSVAGVEFEGTIYVGLNFDDDWVGAIFSFQVLTLSHTTIVIFMYFLGQFQLLPANELKGWEKKRQKRQYEDGSVAAQEGEIFDWTGGHQHFCSHPKARVCARTDGAAVDSYNFHQQQRG